MSIRCLDENERAEWPKLARRIDVELAGKTEAQLLEILEGFKCEVEKAEIACLVAERRLRKRGNEEFHNPMPTRKAVEAVQLAFPKFSPKMVRL